MNEVYIKEAVDQIIPKSKNNHEYKAKLEKLIQQAMLGEFSDADIKEAITLVDIKATNDENYNES